MKLDEFSNDHHADLRTWVQLWLHELTTTGLATDPLAFDDATLTHALELRRFGLDPIDAARRLFGTLH